MFNIKVNNVVLDLSPDGRFAIPFFLNNPLFNEIQSHTLDFNFPLTDKNRAALNFPDDPHFVITNYKVPATLCLYNELIAYCTLTIEGTSDSGISAFLTFGQGNFAEAAGNTNMKDIALPVISLGNDTQDVVNYILDIIAKSIDNLDVNGIPVAFNFPMAKAPDFYGDKNVAFQALNLWNFGAECPWENIIASDGNDNLNAVVPFFYLRWILSKIAANFNLKCSGPFFADNKFKNLLLLNNYDLANKIKKYFVRASLTADQKLDLLPSVSNAIQTDDDSSYPNEDNDNVWGLMPSRYICKSRGIHRFKFKGFVSHDYNNNATIRIGVRNVTIGGAWLHYLEFEIPENEELLIEYETSIYLEDSNVNDLFEIVSSSAYWYGSGYFYTIKENSYIVVSNDSYINLNRFATTVNAANHMPDMSVNEFINNICSYLGLAAFVNDFKNELYITPVNSIYLDPDVIDITNLISGPPTVEKIFKNRIVFAANHISKSVTLYNYLGEFDTFNDLIDPSAGNLIAKIKTTGVWYISYFDDEDLLTKWKKYDDDFEPVEIGNAIDELLEIKPSVRPCPMINDGAVTIMPESSMNASSPAFDTGINNFDLELIQYHGMQDGPYTGKQYPCASALRYDPRGVDFSGYDLTPQWIYHNHLKQHFMQLSKANRILNFPCFLSYYDIRNIKLWKKHRIHNLVGIIVGIEGQFQANAPGPCQIKFLPL